MISYLLSVVICIAVLIMLLWHLWGIAHGETSVEAQDHAVYRKIAKGRGEVREFFLPYTSSVLIVLEAFINSYDLGYVNRLTSDPEFVTKRQQSAQQSCPILQYRTRWIVRYTFFDQSPFNDSDHDFEAHYILCSFRLESCRTRMGIHGQDAKVLSGTSAFGKGKN